MKVISLRENKEYLEKTLQYIKKSYTNVDTKMYEDCVRNCITTENPLPQWYVLEKDKKIIGCGGVITNDFISRMDLYPWISSLFIEEEYRGHEYSALILKKAKEDAIKAGFKNLYLCTDYEGSYERYNYKYIGNGFHPWGDESRIYELDLR